jgi:hypothetical protein
MTFSSNVFFSPTVKFMREIFLYFCDSLKISTVPYTELTFSEVTDLPIG